MVTYKLVVRDVKGDGSCFFRALYNAARHTGNLKAIILAIRIPQVPYPKIWDEDGFVHFIRKTLADSLTKSNVFPLITNIYKHLREVRKESKETYLAILEAYPSWFKTAFKRIPRKVEDFVNVLASKITNKKNWVSEIEIRVLMHLFNGIPIEILNRVPSPKRKGLNCDTIYLLNLGEAHYNYILCRDCTPNILNPKTSRCVNPNGPTGKRLLKSNDIEQ